jgi:hypothetical protein
LSPCNNRPAGDPHIGDLFAPGAKHQLRHRVVNRLQVGVREVDRDEVRPLAGGDAADLVTELSSLPPSMRSAGPQSQGHVVAARVPADKVDAPATLATPSCPMCSASMVLRTAREGRHAGRGFWACSRRKECKGIRALA